MPTLRFVVIARRRGEFRVSGSDHRLNFGARKFVHALPDYPACRASARRLSDRGRVMLMPVATLSTVSCPSKVKIM
ncbi:hypothetical protein GCM10012275_30290 [Longimycelium tulufanense]|uniref:Uncharacterized protein n=1 Tax=Longimycelium tulufanense TaxID=907463 RepID=A0A8J3FUB1_9PSEU|nr:hypothetical protein GCM10012275_30290 [Longimycelium tulufanense]